VPGQKVQKTKQFVRPANIGEAHPVRRKPPQPQHGCLDPRATRGLDRALGEQA
jgi:hypothetical protein